LLQSTATGAAVHPRADSDSGVGDETPDSSLENQENADPNATADFIEHAMGWNVS